MAVHSTRPLRSSTGGHTAGQRWVLSRSVRSVIFKDMISVWLVKLGLIIIISGNYCHQTEYTQKGMGLLCLPLIGLLLNSIQQKALSPLMLRGSNMPTFLHCTPLPMICGLWSEELKDIVPTFSHFNGIEMNCTASKWCLKSISNYCGQREWNCFLWAAYLVIAVLLEGVVLHYLDKTKRKWGKAGFLFSSNHSI